MERYLELSGGLPPDNFDLYGQGTTFAVGLKAYSKAQNVDDKPECNEQIYAWNTYTLFPSVVTFITMAATFVAVKRSNGQIGVLATAAQESPIGLLAFTLAATVGGISLDRKILKWTVDRNETENDVGDDSQNYVVDAAILSASVGSVGLALSYALTLLKREGLDTSKMGTFASATGKFPLTFAKSCVIISLTSYLVSRWLSVSAIKHNCADKPIVWP